MLALWNEGTPYWQIALPYVCIGIGVGLAGTPASNSLTGSVPVKRVGMASGTADLQRDLGGALMTSILGSVLTTHYASAIAAQSVSSQVSSSTESQLQLSFASAENIAQHYPQDADAIIAAAQSSFLQGDQWAYAAGLIAVIVGAVLVFFLFPKRERERELHATYASEDASAPASRSSPAGLEPAAAEGSDPQAQTIDGGV